MPRRKNYNTGFARTNALRKAKLCTVDTCCPSRKVCRTKQEARQDLVKAVYARGSHGTIALIRAAYCCPQCGFWHLTRSLPRHGQSPELHMVAGDQAA